MSLNKAHAIVLYDDENKTVIGCTIYKTYEKAVKDLVKIVVKQNEDEEETLTAKNIKKFIKENDSTYNDETDLISCMWKYYIIDVH